MAMVTTTTAVEIILEDTISIQSILLYSVQLNRNYCTLLYCKYKYKCKYWLVSKKETHPFLEAHQVKQIFFSVVLKSLLLILILMST